MSDLTRSLQDYLLNPSDPRANFDLGVAYEGLNQTASSSSFFLRAAEKTLDKDLQYCALIRNARCFEKQGKRDLTVKTLIQRAIALCPTRPEGYFFLSRLYERQKNYHDCYCMACLGLQNAKVFDPRIPEYNGEYLLLFQKAIGAWWVGLTEESRDILFDLQMNYSLPPEYHSLVANNLQTLGYPKRKLVYQNSFLDHLRHKFPGVETIRNNYSQVFQDMFVLTVLQGKRDGVYLEIGASDPFYNNNTALLETNFGWTGLSLEIDPKEVKKFKEQRKNPILELDATKVDFKKLLEHLPETLDYLQVDCDPDEVSFSILCALLNSGKRFRVLTFEHDAYVGGTVRERSRTLLEDHGYSLRVPNVAFNEKNAFEDWWVLPEEVGLEFKECSEKPINFAMDVLFTQH